MFGRGRSRDSVFSGWKKHEKKVPSQVVSKNCKYADTKLKKWNSHLWSRDEEEASGQEQALQSRLEITELDSLEVENRLTVGQH